MSFKFLLTFLSAVAIASGCTPDDQPEAPRDDRAVFTITPESGFESLWKQGGDALLYEVGTADCREYHVTLEKDPSFGLCVRCKLDGTIKGMRRYHVVSSALGGDVFEFPSEQTVSGRVPGALRAVAVSDVYSSLPPAGTGVSMKTSHIGSIVGLALSGLPSDGVDKVVLEFPVEVCGSLKMDWASGSLAREPGAPDGSSLTIIPSGEEIQAVIAPVSLARGAEIGVSVWIGSAEYRTTYVLPDAVAPSGNIGMPVVFEKPQKIYTNPVTTIAAADPTVWYYSGMFYLYSTMGSSVKKMYQSKDLTSWATTGRTPFTEETNSSLVAYGASRWAPDVVKIGDTWNFYITVRNDASSGIAVLTSKSALGPFVLQGRITYSRDTGINDSIDPEVVRDPATGKVWLFFGSTGKMHRVELNAAGTALAPGAKYEHVAGLGINENPVRDKVFEGSYLYYRDGYWYLFCSAGQYWNDTYKVVVGRSETLEGTFLSKDGGKMTEGKATVILSSKSGDRFFGPGHNGEIYTDKYGDDYMVYHCHDRNAGDNEKRFLMLQKICWSSDGWPYFEGGKPVGSGIAPVF